jgi:hypothetical protein
LVDERNTLQNALQKNQRDQTQQQAEVQRLEQQLRNLRETRAVVLGMQSLEPVGISRALMVLLSILLGGLLALLVPLVLEFLGRVREGLREPAPGAVSAGATEVGI